MAIQDLPMLLVANILVSIVGSVKMPPKPRDINALVKAYEGTLVEKRIAAMLCVFGVRCVENYEDFTGYLETLIHRELGYPSPPGTYEPEMRMVVPHDIPAAEMTVQVPIGCPLPRIPEKDRIEKIANWHQSQRAGNPLQANFMASLAGLRIKRLNLLELLAAYDAEREDTKDPT
jgi:hypothetical protein